jgi:hypothetical protein
VRTAPGMPASRLILAWNSTSSNPLIRSFGRIAVANYRAAAAAK